VRPKDETDLPLATFYIAGEKKTFQISPIFESWVMCHWIFPATNHYASHLFFEAS
jgi:hypothetical protein